MHGMDQGKCNVKLDQDFQKEGADCPVLNTNDEYDCIYFYSEPSVFNCDSSYDISSSSLIKSTLICEILLSHGLLKKVHVDHNNLNSSFTENDICSNENSAGRASLLDVFSLQPPSNWNDYTEEDDEDVNGDYKCGWESCDSSFTCRKDLAHHVNSSHINPDENSLFRCLWNGCARQGKAINAKYRMQIHVRTHTHEKPHGCDVCGKKFSRLENLRIHIRSHTGEKPYVCQVAGCNKAYSNSSDRFKHLKTHQEDKPYVCRVEGCDKRYTDPSSLRKHMKSTAHTGENMNKSDVSSLGCIGDIQNNFSSSEFSSSPLKRSTNVVNANRPYACKVEGCNKRYTDPSSLRKHQRATSHGRDPNAFKGRVRVQKAVQIKNSIIQPQVSSAIKSIKYPESPQSYKKTTKEPCLQKVQSVADKVKCNITGAKPLDLSFGCTSSDDCSVTSQATVEKIV